MKAITFPEFGPPEVLEVGDVADPQPGPGEVLVGVDAVGVCHHDVLHRAGQLPKSRPGMVLGHEICGHIEGAGEGVEVSLGQRVVVQNRLSCLKCADCLRGRSDLCRNSWLLGSNLAGGYAERLVVPESAIFAVEDLEATHAALAVCPIGTSARALLTVAEVSPGDVVVITGSTGGLGLHQIQIAASLGAHPIAVTTSGDRVGDLRSFGAAEVIVAGDEKLRHQIRAAAGAVDVLIDNVVSATLSEAIWSLRPGGIAVLLGNIEMRDTSINPGLMIERRLRVVGSGSPTATDIRKSIALIAAGMVVPVVGAVLPFPAASEAHQLVESREVLGRVVLSGW